MVPDTPEEVQRTYAEVARVRFASPPVRPQRPARQQLQSAITIPPRSNYFTQRRPSPPRQAYGRFSPAWRHPPPQPAEELEPGCCRVQSRRRSTRRQPEVRRSTTLPWHGRRPTSTGDGSISPGLQAFRQKTLGRCFVCLSTSHRAAVCRNPIRCFRCRCFGHKERDCRATARSSGHKERDCRATARSTPYGRRVPVDKVWVPTATPQRKEEEVLPPPPTCVEGTTMLQVGDAAIRPEEDCIDVDLHAWENTVLVSWAMRAPQGTGAADVAAVLREEFRLHHDEVTVTNHHPEAFLIRFKHGGHCAEAAKKGHANRQGVEIHFIKWRSLRHAGGALLMYRVRLCLDGVPGHAWTEDIVEKIISRRCELEQVETNIMLPAETKTIDLWAWTADPSAISKQRPLFV